MHPDVHFSWGGLKPTQLPSLLNVALHAMCSNVLDSLPGSEEVILPDFGEGFGNSDGLLLDVAGASSLP